MSLFFADLVREFSHGTGAGDFVLSGAVPGHRRFGDVVPAGARFHYAIAGVARADEWETGEGEIGSGGVLVRMPFASSAGGGLVAFSAGLKSVALTVGASWYADQEEGGAVGIGDVDGLASALAGKATSAHAHDGVYAPVAHGHDGIYAPVAHHHDGAYQPIDAELSALAGLTGQADRMAYFTGPGAAALAPLSGFGRSLVDDADAAAGRATLGLGNAATRNIGTSGGAVPLLDGANSWSAGQMVAGVVTLSASGIDIAAGARLVSPAVRCEAASPSITIKDTDSAGTAMTGYFHFWDSGNSVTARIGRPFGDGNLWIENEGGTIYFALGIGSGAALINAASFDLLGSRAYRVGGTQVVGARVTGWAPATGTATRTSFDTASVSTAALAERVKALIDDLRTHGLIGS